MPLINLIIGLIVVGVPLWLTFVFVVVKIQSSDPGEALLVDESVAGSGHAVAYAIDEGRNGLRDSVSKRRAQFDGDGQEDLRIHNLGISTVGQGELHPVATPGPSWHFHLHGRPASDETENGRQQNGRVETAIQPNNKMKKVAENG